MYKRQLLTIQGRRGGPAAAGVAAVVQLPDPDAIGSTVLPQRLNAFLDALVGLRVAVGGRTCSDEQTNNAIPLSAADGVLHFDHPRCST